MSVCVCLRAYLCKFFCMFFLFFQSAFLMKCVPACKYVRTQRSNSKTK